MITNYLEYLSVASKMAEYQRIFHSGGESPITDDEYDRTRKELMAWEEANPDQTLELSPAYTVGYIDPENIKDALRHEYPMLSLENALDSDEAEGWAQLWTNKFGPDVRVVGEFKYDGVALSALYIDGVFTRALTRGDGMFGEDVTKHAAKFMKPHIDAQGTVEIRGEAVVKKAWLEIVNEGPTAYVNCRSAVAGLLNCDQPNSYTHGISFIPYDIASSEFVFDEHTKKLETLKNLGFQMFSCFLLTPSAITDVFESVTEVRDRGDVPFDIDGMVFKINDTAKQEELGTTNHHPKHQFAYKFPPTTGECRIVDVVFQVGRTGEIAPVAKITATPLMGVVVTSVSLHNEDRIRMKQIAIGNSYEVYRSGDVIPHFGKLLHTSPDARPVVFPAECPCCGTPIVKRGATYYCPNTQGCSAQHIATIAYATSRDVLNIEGLGERTVKLLYDAKLIRYTADLWQLRAADVAKLDGYTEYSAKNLKEAIAYVQETSMDKFIMALGIPEVGKITARKIAHRLHLRRTLFELDTPEKVLDLKVADIGPAIANNIAAYFADPGLKDNAIRLLDHVGATSMAKFEPIPGVENKTFVFTGRFSMTREMMENKVLAAGGAIANGVGPNTDYLVVGENPGEKSRRATLLGVETIDERVFLSLFE